MKEQVLKELEKEYGVIKDIPDVNNKLYDAYPQLMEATVNPKDFRTVERKILGYDVLIREYSPTNDCGKLKEGYYFIMYQILDK